MIDIFGTLGPACAGEDMLYGMFKEGMTGIRINLSHTMLSECAESLEKVHRAADRCGITPKILIDMQGPELRIADLPSPVQLREGELFYLGPDAPCRESINSNNGMRIGVPLWPFVFEHIKPGQEILLDDGRIAATVVSISSREAQLKAVRGGLLSGKKSLAIEGVCLDLPAVTEDDRINLSQALQLGVTGVMQPFVRSRNDLIQLRDAVNDNRGQNIKIYAKIENIRGVENLESFFPYADEIVIARGDLGNCMPLWELPGVQKKISKACLKQGMPFMVVTQMLASMEHCKVPTRAEVSDIYNAVLDGAESVMVTGETAAGEYPVSVIRYLRKTAEQAEIDRNRPNEEGIL